MPVDQEIEVELHEAIDIGHAELHDVYSFPTVAAEPGKPIQRLRAPDPQAALTLAREQFGARADRFVNEGVSQSEYADYLEGRGRSA